MTCFHLLRTPLRSALGSFLDMQCLLAKGIQPARLVARVPRATKATVLATPLSLTGAGNPISPQASPRERESPRHFLDPFRTKVLPDAHPKDCQCASTTTLHMDAHVQVTVRAALMCVSVATPSSIAPAAELQAWTLAFRIPLISSRFWPLSFHYLTRYHFQLSSALKYFPVLVAYPEPSHLMDFNALQWTTCGHQVCIHGFLTFAIHNTRICSYPYCTNVFPILFGLRHLAAPRPEPDQSPLTRPQVYHNLALFDLRLGQMDCRPCARQRPSESKTPMRCASWWAAPCNCAVTTSLSWWNNPSTV